mgnify:CR=1 FL=1
MWLNLRNLYNYVSIKINVITHIDIFVKRSFIIVFVNPIILYQVADQRPNIDSFQMFDFENAKMNKIQYKMQLCAFFLVMNLLSWKLHDHVPLVLRNLPYFSIILNVFVSENFLKENTILRINIDFVFCEVVT